MAGTSGKSERKKIKNQVLEDLLLSYTIEKNENSFKTWNRNWAWLIEEYAELQRKGAEVTKKSDLLTSVHGEQREKDMRTIKPIPPTTNGWYGYVPNKPEFALEIYGRDVYAPPALPEQYVLNTTPE